MLPEGSVQYEKLTFLDRFRYTYEGYRETFSESEPEDENKQGTDARVET